jgi:hypothetical protein
MLESVPGTQNIGDAYRRVVVDSMYDDPEVWGDYQVGFSAPLIVRAIREGRRQGVLSSAAAFIALCTRHRAWFRGSDKARRVSST